MSDPVSQWRAKVNIASNRVGAMNTALIAIQEMHLPVIEDGEPVGCLLCDWEMDGVWPCKTRKLADEGLTEHSSKETQ